MNSREALRLADPARQLPPHHLEPTDEALLRQILATPDTAANEESAHLASKRRSARREWRPVLVTGVVAVAVVAGAFAVIRTTSTSSPNPATSRSDNASLEAVVQAELAEAAAGRVIDPDQPSLYWTQAQHGSQGDMIDLTGKTLYLAGACEGGGAVTIQISGEPDIVLDCSTRTTVGPINLTAIITRQKNGASVDVAATDGRPRYLIKELAFPTPGVTINASGQTSGPDTGEQRPDLIAAIATNGKTGYVSARELDAADPCRDPASPTAAIRCNQDHANDVITIPVYKNEGNTVIGTCRIGG